MLADQVEVVIGVDTHRDTHSLGAVGAATGVVLFETRIEASPCGYRRALQLVAQRSSGRRAWALEGSGSYGAGLARFLIARGERVIELARPPRAGRRSQAKDDRIDALRAARGALAADALASPRAGGVREAMRVLMVTRSSAVDTRRQAIRQLKSLIVTAPDELRERLRGLNKATLLAACARLRVRRDAQPALAATTRALRTLARRAQSATVEARALEREIAGHVRELCPQLLAERGVGPISAAQLLISYSHKGRWRRESAFARLGATAPIPASSGQVVRHRLDPGGDRQLNRALHTIVLVRRQRDPATRAYIERRVREGKSTREAVRCLKRYLARHLYRVMEASSVRP